MPAISPPGASPPELARCAPWTEAAKLDPVGTAGSHRAYLLVDWPLPWPRDVGEIEALAGLRPALAAAGCRLQAMVAPGDVAERRVILYHRDPGPFVRFERREALVGPDGVVAAAAGLLAGAVAAGEDTAEEDTARWGAGGGAPAGPGARSDLLVCTHGRRDRCCGSLGTDLAIGLLAGAGDLGDDVVVSRTSHTGGHRFAPTAMLFPHGTVWAFADADLLGRVIHRRGPVDAVLSRYRGCTGVGGPAVQAVERAVLGHLGWSLWDRPRWGQELDGGRTQLHVADPAGGPAEVWEATVGPGRVLAAPACGGPADQAVGTAGELVAGPLRRLA